MSEEPRDQSFDTFDAYRAAVRDAIAAARRSVTVFDHDLAETGIESAAVVEALVALARAASRADAIRILVRDPAYVENRCPRLRRLAAQFGHRLQFRVTGEGLELPDGCFVVVDDIVLVRRFHADRARGALARPPSPEPARYAAQFETLWIGSNEGPALSVLGL